MQPTQETKGQAAQRLFEEGYNCCQAVAVAFAPEMGLPTETVARLASGFGGGMGRMREVCGAVSGMVLVAGMLRGYHSPAAEAEKADTYTRVQQMAACFRAETGSIICRELLNLPAGGSNPQPEARTQHYYQKRPCAQMCRIAADILADTVIAASPQAVCETT